MIVVGVSGTGPTRRATFGGGLECSFYNDFLRFNIFFIKQISLETYLGGIFRLISTFCTGDALLSSAFSVIVDCVSSLDSCCCVGKTGAGFDGSGPMSEMSFAAIEIDVEVCDVAMADGIGDGSFTSITVTKLVGVSDRVGDSIFESFAIAFMICVFRKCDVSSSMH